MDEYPLIREALATGTITTVYHYGDGWEPGYAEWFLNGKEIKEDSPLGDELLTAHIEDHLILNVLVHAHTYVRERLVGLTPVDRNANS